MTRAFRHLAHRKSIFLVAAMFWLGTLAVAATTSSAEGKRMGDELSTVTLDRGCIVRGPKDKPRIALEFTGGSFADGGTTILRELQARGVHASFFFIGDFYREPKFKSLIESIRDHGHYLGPHSDKHPLYASWENPPKLEISREDFLADLRANMAELEKFGVSKEKAKYFIPPYEHYTPEIAEWTREEGMVLINYTPGARSHADYMEDKDPKFISAPDMVKSVLDYEKSHEYGLNGFMLLMHIGAGPGRTRDHLYDYLGSMLDELIGRGYSFVRIDQLLEGKVP
jgi:peptidoglycan/xylan/chitin deacetylase (PgdA/CDA1 family)